MAERKKQPKRGSRKPTKKRTPKKRNELKPHKIVGQLFGALYNEHGEQIGEEVMGNVEIFRANFGKVPQLVDQALKEKKKAEEQGE